MESERNIGVGPHPQPWPTGPQYDQTLLAQGDRRNVPDQYRYYTVEAIKEAIAEQAVELEVAIENWQHDSNIGTIVRTANAFNVAKVHIIGKRHWNRRGAMVTDRYMTIEHHADVASFVKAVKKKALIAIDIINGAEPLHQIALPRNAVLVFGGEGPGISDEMLAVCQRTVMIEQFGSTRSINIGVAAGILMYQWRSQHDLLR